MSKPKAQDLAELLDAALIELNNAAYYLEKSDAEDVLELCAKIRIVLDAMGWKGHEV